MFKESSVVYSSILFTSKKVKTETGILCVRQVATFDRAKLDIKQT